LARRTDVGAAAYRLVQTLQTTSRSNGSWHRLGPTARLGNHVFELPSIRKGRRTSQRMGRVGQAWCI